MKAKSNYCPHCGKPMGEEEKKNPVDAVIEALDTIRGETDEEGEDN